MWIHMWDEISCEWRQVELDLPRDASPEEIVRAVDEATFEPVGFAPSEELWSVKAHGRAGPLLTIECRTGRGHLGIVLVNYEENGLRIPEGPPFASCVGAIHSES
jgi:hypothetical protein